MARLVEAAREAWGLATMVGVAGKGETLDIVPRLLITGRRVTGSSFGGVKGRTQVPQLVDRWLAGEIDVESLLSHRLTLDEVNGGFDAHGGARRHPQRHRVRVEASNVRLASDRGRIYPDADVRPLTRPWLVLAIAVAVVALPALASGRSLGAGSEQHVVSGLDRRDAAAPDITTLTTSNTDAGRLSFRVNVPNRPTFGQDMLIELFVDSDNNTSTGDSDPLTAGADYAIEIFGGAPRCSGGTAPASRAARATRRRRA